MNTKYLLIPVALFIAGMSTCLFFFIFSGTSGKEENSAAERDPNKVYLTPAPDFGEPLDHPPNMVGIQQISYSPDGKKILFNYNFPKDTNWHRNLVIYDINSGEYKTVIGGKEGYGRIDLAAWFPAGEKLAFTRMIWEGRTSYDFHTVDINSGEESEIYGMIKGGRWIAGVNESEIVILSSDYSKNIVQIFGIPHEVGGEKKLLKEMPYFTINDGVKNSCRWDSFRFCPETNEMFFIVMKNTEGEKRASLKNDSIYKVSLNEPDNSPEKVKLPDEIKSPTSFELNEDGTKIAIGSYAGGMYICDLVNCELIKKYPGPAHVAPLSFFGNSVIFRGSPRGYRVIENDDLRKTAVFKPYIVTINE